MCNSRRPSIVSVVDRVGPWRLEHESLLDVRSKASTTAPSSEKSGVPGEILLGAKRLRHCVPHIGTRSRYMTVVGSTRPLSTPGLRWAIHPIPVWNRRILPVSALSASAAPAAARRQRPAFASRSATESRDQSKPRNSIDDRTTANHR